MTRSETYSIDGGVWGLKGSKEGKSDANRSLSAVEPGWFYIADRKFQYRVAAQEVCALVGKSVPIKSCSWTLHDSLQES